MWRCSSIRGAQSTHYLNAFAAEAQALGVRLHRVDATPETMDVPLTTITTSGADALLIQDSPRLHAHRHRVLAYARTHRLPTACGVRAYAEAGCLIAYAPDILAMYRRAAVFADKILKGPKPADLPIFGEANDIVSVSSARVKAGQPALSFMLA